MTSWPRKFKVQAGIASPVYRQLVEKVIRDVREGELAPGDRLPPERVLAERLGIARGTIGRAYAELERARVIDVVRGRGSVVSARQDVAGGDRGAKAASLVRDTIERLVRLRFSLREIRDMIDLAVREREERLAALAVAAVDCNPEALGIWERQLGLLSRLSVKKLLLDELARDPDPASRLAGFDLVITTLTHRTELASLAPDADARIVAVGVSPSQQTIAGLAALRPSQAVGILCESVQFLRIVQARLHDLGLGDGATHLLLPAEAATIERFLADRDVLVAPPGIRAALDRDTARALQQFDERGGSVLAFDYRIEGGSLAHLEERIRAIASGDGGPS
jgi:DNA-binding transcriptional regulator YhcF (GntR family)